jgi:amphiphysin
MADSKAAMIGKIVQKQAGRAKERVLQSLGKVDKTNDEIFDEYVQNFNRQQLAANHLHKELHNYLRCVRAMQASSKSLFDVLAQMHEPNWVGHDVMVIQSQSLEMLWNDLITKLQDQVLVPLNTYITQFPEVRKRVDKRNRKLTDYDAHRHNLQTLQSNPKKRDEVKIARAKEQLEEARRTYEMLNIDLHDELPALHDSRIPFFVSNLQTVSSAETLFHSETSKVYSELEAVMEQLAKETQAGKYAGTKYALNSSPSPNTSGSGYPVTSSNPTESFLSRIKARFFSS